MRQGSEESERLRTRRRWARRALEIVLVAAALVLAVQMLSEVGWASLENRIRAADPRLAGLAAVLLIGRWLVWNLRWRLALRRIDAVVAWFRSLGALVAATAVNHLTPAFRILGGLLRARYTSDGEAGRFATIYGSILFDQIINQVVMGALSAIAFIALSWQLGRANQSVVAALLLTSLILLLPLLYRRLRRSSLVHAALVAPSSSAAPRWTRGLALGGRDALLTMKSLLTDRALLPPAVVLSGIYALLNLAAAWVAFAALGELPPPSWVFYSVSLGVTIGAVSGTPGGGLTTEAAMVACYTLLGMDRSTAVAATLLYRGLHYALVIALGLPSLLTLEWLHRRRGSVGIGPRRPSGLAP